MVWVQKYIIAKIQTSSQAKLLLNFNQESLLYFVFISSELACSS